jgi:hypothetical protein
MDTCELLTVDGQKCSYKSIFIKNIVGDIVNCKSYCLSHINKIIDDFTKQYEYVKIQDVNIKNNNTLNDVSLRFDEFGIPIQNENKENNEDTNIYKILKTTTNINDKLINEYKNNYDKLKNLITTTPLNINITLTLNKPINITTNKITNKKLYSFANSIYDNTNKKYIIGEFNRWITSKEWIIDENMLYIEYKIDYIDNVKSLDTEELTNKFITINLITQTNKDISINYPVDLLLKFKNICGMCSGLSNKNFNNTVLNLQDFKLNSFTTLMDSLESGKYPILTKDLDILNLHELCKYMNVYPQLIDYTNLNSDYIFLKNIPEYDKIMVLEERKLRKMLFNDENKIDSNELLKTLNEKYKLNNVINYVKSLNIPEYHHVYSKNYIKTINNNFCSIKAYKNVYNNRFNNFTEPGIIHTLNNLKLNFNNFCLAGGFYTADFKYKKFYSDLDFFITTKDINLAIEAINHIYSILCIDSNSTAVISTNSQLYNILLRNKDRYINQGVKYIETDSGDIKIKIPNSFTRIVVSDKSISFFSKLGIQVQIILRLYNSTIQVISGFDIDSCCVAYDGYEFYAMPRFVRSLITRYNLIDPERQSENYCQRLNKYMNKGFDIAFVLDLKRIDTEFLNNKYLNHNDYKGLKKILIFFNNIHKNSQLVNCYLYKKDYGYMNAFDIQTIYKYIFALVIKYDRKHKNEDLRYFGIEYRENNFLTGFDTDENGNLLISNNISNYINKYNLSFPILILNDINQVINKLTTNDLQINDTITLFNTVNNHTTLKNKIQFITKNPGTQLTNSFHPTNEDWYYDLYVRN